MRPPLIENLQYAKFTPGIFEQMGAGGVDAVHVTIAYHESLREMGLTLGQWNRWFEAHTDLIFKGTVCAAHTRRAARRFFFGFQSPSTIEDDIGLVEICHQLGIRFMQLTYNNQPLLATGCYEDYTAGLSRMGRQVVTEMNRAGLVVDCPISITRANPAWWHKALRNKSDEALRALTENGVFWLFRSFS